MASAHSSVIVTLAAVDSRARDELSFTFPARPQPMTIYLRFVEGTPGTQLSGILTVGSITNTVPRIAIYRTGASNYETLYGNGLAQVASTVSAAAVVIGDFVELRVTVSATGSVQTHLSRNGGAETSGSASAAIALPVAWNVTKVLVNAFDASSQGLVAWRNIKIVAGVKTMQEMRRLAGVV